MRTAPELQLGGGFLFGGQSAYHSRTDRITPGEPATTTPPSPTFITGPGWRAAVIDRRHGIRSVPPLLVVHGLADSSLVTFGPLVAGEPWASAPVILLDLPGFGMSHADDAWPATVEDHAAVALTVLDRLGVERVRWLGHSLGGSVGIIAATLAPARIEMLIMAEALLLPENSILASSIARRSQVAFEQRGMALLARATRQQAARGEPAAIAFEETLHLASPRHTYRTAVSLVRRREPSFQEVLCQLSMPRGYLIGSRTAVETARIERCGVVVRRIEGAGHAMMTEQPARFLGELAALIAVLSTDGR